MNLYLEMPDYTGFRLQVSQRSPNPDLSLHSPNSLCSQNTKSYLRNRGLSNYQPTSVRCSFCEEKNILSPWAIDRTAPVKPKAKSLDCIKLSAMRAMPWLLEVDVGRCTIWKPFVWSRAPWKLCCFTLPVGTWLGALKQSLRTDRTARGHGQVRRSSQSHEPKLRTLSQKLGNRNAVFIATLSTVQLARLDVCIFLYSTSKGQARCKRSTTAIRCGAELELSQPHNPLSAPLCRKSTRTQAQLHSLGFKVDLTWLQLFSQTARLCFRSQKTVRGRSQISCAIDDVATGRSRAKKNRGPYREAYSHVRQRMRLVETTVLRSGARLPHWAPQPVWKAIASIVWFGLPLMINFPFQEIGRVTHPVSSSFVSSDSAQGCE